MGRGQGSDMSDTNPHYPRSRWSDGEGASWDASPEKSPEKEEWPEYWWHQENINVLNQEIENVETKITKYESEIEELQNQVDTYYGDWETTAAIIHGMNATLAELKMLHETRLTKLEDEKRMMEECRRRM